MSSDDSGLARASTRWRLVPLGAVLLLGSLMLSACGDSGFRPPYASVGAKDGQIPERLKHFDPRPTPGRLDKLFHNGLI